MAFPDVCTDSPCDLLAVRGWSAIWGGLIGQQENKLFLKHVDIIKDFTKDYVTATKNCSIVPSLSVPLSYELQLWK